MRKPRLLDSVRLAFAACLRALRVGVRESAAMEGQLNIMGDIGVKRESAYRHARICSEATRAVRSVRRAEGKDAK